jgi:serine/threonine protein kinase
MPVTDRLPATLGPYRLQERLGEGGMGVVHLARDADGQPVAIKVLRNVGYADPNGRRRLIREVETMRRVRSPYVAEVLDADVTGEYPYIVTRYVAGPTLDQLVQRQGPMSPAGVQRLAHGLAEALAAIHAAGIVHRDLKPGNVMLTDDRPVVIDFGIAQAPESTRLTQTGMVMGTPGYLAPEVIEGQPSSPASDVHAWGATVAFAATGQAPFGTGSFETIFYRVVSGRADLTGVPSSLVPAVSAALARDPARRPSAGWLSSAIPAAGSTFAAVSAGAIGAAVDAGRAGAAAAPAAVPAAARATFSPSKNPPPPSKNGPPPSKNPPPELLPRTPIGRAGIPDDEARARRQPRPPRVTDPKWLPGLAFTVAAAALTVVLPVAGLIASLALITVLRAADMAQHRLAVRRNSGGNPLSTLLFTPFSMVRALISTALLAPFALVVGGLAWAVTIVVTHHATASKSVAFAAAAVVVWYGVGPGSGKPRRQLRRIAGSIARTPMSATAATIACWALAAAAITFAMSQTPDYWPAVLPAVPHASLPHLPGVPRIPSLDSLVSSTAGWLTRHAHT